jgi:predicted metal-dependent phosphoesterase TrpH
LRIDLHAHSTHSDGREDVHTIFASAQVAGVDVLALTDHDSTAGWAEAAEVATELGMGFVPGIEVTTMAQGQNKPFSVHLLAYLPDPNNVALQSVLRNTVVAREQRLRDITELVSPVWSITWDDVMAQLRDGATMGRPAVADALVAAGHFANRGEVFEQVLYDGSEFYVSNESAPNVLEAIALIRGAGGVPIIAHPLGRSAGNHALPEEHFRAMIEAGLAGFEVYHRDVPQFARDWLLGLAEEFDLVVTGSSDYHGLTGKENRLGENLTEPEMLERIAAQGFSDVIYP